MEGSGKLVMEEDCEPGVEGLGRSVKVGWLTMDGVSEPVVLGVCEPVFEGLGESVSVKVGRPIMEGIGEPPLEREVGK